MNFATVIGTFSKRPARQTIAGIAAVFAGLILVTPQGIAASGQNEPVPQASAKPETGSPPPKTELITISAQFLEFTAPALAEVTAPGGVLEKFAPSKSPENTVHILAPEQQEALFRVLNHTKGVDLACTPRATLKSGQRAEIEMTREIKFPTEWAFDKKLQQHTPTAFEVKRVGVILEAEVTAKPDGEGIDLQTIPQIVEFLGYLSAGSNILTGNPDPHYPYSPVFRIRKADIHIDYISGHTALIWLKEPFSEKEKLSGQRATVVLVTAKKASD